MYRWMHCYIYQSVEPQTPEGHIHKVLVCPRFSNEKCVPNEFMVSMSSAQRDWLKSHSQSAINVYGRLNERKSKKCARQPPHVQLVGFRAFCCFKVRYIFCKHWIEVISLWLLSVLWWPEHILLNIKHLNVLFIYWYVRPI